MDGRKDWYCLSYIHGWKKGLVLFILHPWIDERIDICLSYIYGWKKELVFFYLTSMDGRKD